MDFLKKLNLQDKPLWKVLLSAGVCLVALIIVFWLLSFALRGARLTAPLPGVSSRMNYGIPGGGYAQDSAVSQEYYEEKGMSIPPVMPGPTLGGDAEKFEVTEYSGYYKVSDINRTCVSIEALKSLEYVVFENAVRNDRNCHFRFKVENNRAEDVKRILEQLNPDELTQVTHTIKPILDEFITEKEILTKKLESIEKTMAEAQRSYDELRDIATRAQNAEALAKVIESKINLIERLTKERLELRERIDRINRQQSLEADRMKYTYFNINVIENPIVDFESLKDAWVLKMQQFTREFNAVIQGITVGLLSLGLRIIQIAIYFVLALFILKYGWRLTKRFWNS